MSKQRPSDGDDLALWRKVTEEVRPLRKAEAKARGAAHDVDTGAEKAKKKPDTRAEAPGKPKAAKPAPPRRQPLPALEAGQVAGVDRRTADRLKRGKLSLEARLDLHGLTQTEAHRALSTFLEASVAAGRRCVLVITGKGMFREGGGVLREAVPRWLNEAPTRGCILSFCQAQPRDGGAGALYILLRRKRPGP